MLRFLIEGRRCSLEERILESLESSFGSLENNIYICQNPTLTEMDAGI
jgi:hypothetical protein